MRLTAETMGTVASLDIPDCDDKSVFDDVFNRLSQIDAKFSPYKKTSQTSRYARGELAEPSGELQEVISACEYWDKKTSGYFSAYYNGQFDPSGYVKGWAIAQAAELVKKAGYNTCCLSIGGDILAASDGPKTWGIGIQDPSDPNKIIKRLEIKNGAIATSGVYERGQHIINPKTAQPANSWASVSVVGPDIVVADVLATTLFAAGEDAPAILQKHQSYEAIFIKKTGQVLLSGAIIGL